MTTIPDCFYRIDPEGTTVGELRLILARLEPETPIVIGDGVNEAGFFVEASSWGMEEEPSFISISSTDEPDLFAD